jgi:hypothetical protein
VPVTHRVARTMQEPSPSLPPKLPNRRRVASGRTLAAALSLAAATMFGSSRALAEPASTEAESACITAYESLQEARAGGALLTARGQAFECANSVCPAFIQKDCAVWIDEIEAELPTVSFDVRSGGEPLRAVRVFEGERLLTDRPGGSAVELDPGAHSLRFEVEGREPVTRSVQVERGRKNQRLGVELPEPPAPRERRPPPPAPPPGVDPRTTSLAPYIVGGLGVAGIAGFAVLGATGLSQEASLDRRCAPHCSEAELRSLRTRYLLADVSLGIGVTGLLVGGYLLFWPSSSDKSATAPSVRVQASARGAMASVRSSF